MDMRTHLPLVLAALLLALTSTAAATARTARAPQVARVQRLAQVMTPHGVHSRPDGHSPVTELVQPRRPLTNERTILPVLARRRGKQGVWWLKVLLPGRPNGHTGWIKKPGTLGAITRYAVVVGKPSTPTPQGRFFVEEWFQITPGSLGGPYALALSARSSVYQEFDGGPGQIALHGVYGIGGTPGTAESHGCIRLDWNAMSWLGTHIHGGVPVTIEA